MRADWPHESNEEYQDVLSGTGSIAQQAVEWAEQVAAASMDAMLVDTSFASFWQHIQQDERLVSGFLQLVDEIKYSGRPQPMLAIAGEETAVHVALIERLVSEASSIDYDWHSEAYELLQLLEAGGDERAIVALRRLRGLLATSDDSP